MLQRAAAKRSSSHLALPKRFRKRKTLKVVDENVNMNVPQHNHHIPSEKLHRESLGSRRGTLCPLSASRPPLAPISDADRVKLPLEFLLPTDVSLMSKRVWQDIFSNECGCLPCVEVKSSERQAIMSHRRAVVDWMSKVCESLGWQENTFITAVNTMDNYLHITNKTVDSHTLPGISVACLFIGAGLGEFCDDYTIPSLREFAECAPYVQDIGQIVTVQLDIIASLGGRFLQKTAFDILVLWLARFRDCSTFGHYYTTLASHGQLQEFFLKVVSVIDASIHSGVSLAITGSTIVASTLLLLLQGSFPEFYSLDLQRSFCEGVLMLDFHERIIQSQDTVSKFLSHSAMFGSEGRRCSSRSSACEGKEQALHLTLHSHQPHDY